MSDNLHDAAVRPHWAEILISARNSGSKVSILITGSYKSFTGKVKKLEIGVVTLENEYSTEYISLSEIRAVRVYD